mmetsp:Transcript_158863/g.280659  ORF Transcript_158863/g.280659 Transcript_158863/m.280659 type:complete len:639 (+) Transcript_158863:83-1999(+)
MVTNMLDAAEEEAGFSDELAEPSSDLTRWLQPMAGTAAGDTEAQQLGSDEEDSDLRGYDTAGVMQGGGAHGSRAHLDAAGGYGAIDSGVDMLLPFWQEDGEHAHHTRNIMEIHTRCCPDFQRGFCAMFKGRGSPCFYYHFQSQARRAPVMDGRLRYWDVQCPVWNGELAFCPHGEACIFAHGRNEVSYHPAKYKTRLCNVTECRGEAVCCFAHTEDELRTWAHERYSYSAHQAASNSFSLQGGAMMTSEAGSSMEAAYGLGAGQGAAGMGPAAQGQRGGAPQQKHRFCASYPQVSQCSRGASCAFAHSREEARTPLLSEAEENHEPKALTEDFFTMKFKILWCPIGAQHDWLSCPYAHTYQDARRDPSIGYGPQPCPYWSKKDTRVAYAQRCPLGLRCPYSHGAKEQLYHPKYFRTVVCRDLDLKGCPRQTLCAFYHHRHERRTAGPDMIDYNQPISKADIPAEWSSRFLSPPFFQETTGNDGNSVMPSTPNMSGPCMAMMPGMSMHRGYPAGQMGGPGQMAIPTMMPTQGSWFGMWGPPGPGGAGSGNPWAAPKMRKGGGQPRNLPAADDTDDFGDVGEQDGSASVGAWPGPAYHPGFTGVPMVPVQWGGMQGYGPVGASQGYPEQFDESAWWGEMH